MTTALQRRFVRGFYAQGFGQVVTAIIQVVAVPVFLAVWGKQLYAEWILLSAIPSYLQISDLSFGTAAANEMTMLMSAGKRSEVQRVYHSSLLFVTCTCALMLGLALLFLWLVPISHLLRLTIVTPAEAKLTLFFLILQVLFAQLGAIYFAAYRCSGHFAVGTLSINLLRLFEFVATIAAVLLHGSFVTVALAYLGTRLVGCVVTGFHLRWLVPWLKLGYRDANAASVKAMLVPALSFNAFPIGLVMNLQGVVFVVNALFGPGMVVVINTTRALSRVLYQFCMVVSGIAWDELSRAFGAEDMRLAVLLHRRACQIGLWGSVLLGGILAVAGPKLYGLWTHHTLVLDKPFFLILLVVSIVSGLYTVSYVVPVSFNKHNRLALIYAGIMTMSIPAAWVGGTVYGMPGVAIGLLLIESTMAFAVFKISFAMLNENAASFFSFIIKPPISWLIGRLRKGDRSERIDNPDAAPAILPTDIPELSLPAPLPEREPYSIALGTLGRFHTFDLARQVQMRAHLTQVFSAYPWFKLKNDGIPKEKVFCRPRRLMTAILYSHSPVQSYRLLQTLEWQAIDDLDRQIARGLRPCDFYIALASVGLHSGKRAKELGATYVCDRPCTHIAVQDELLRQAFDVAKVPYGGIDRRVIEKELAEYEQADLILVPSTFSRQTFLDQGIASEKLLMAPYGVDFTRFSPIDSPTSERFDVLFVGAASMRKGTAALIEAFRLVRHPKKRLTFIGAVLNEVKSFVREAQSLGEIEVMGIQPKTVLREVMSRSHVLVLPSVEDGFGLVMAEAMACRCPVIASDHTGARDLFTHEREGLIFPSGNIESLAEAMQRLADNPDLREAMAAASLQRVHELEGWNTYAGIVLGGLRSMYDRQASQIHSPIRV